MCTYHFEMHCLHFTIINVSHKENLYSNPANNWKISKIIKYRLKYNINHILHSPFYENTAWQIKSIKENSRTVLGKYFGHKAFVFLFKTNATALYAFSNILKAVLGVVWVPEIQIWDLYDSQTAVLNISLWSKWFRAYDNNNDS